MMWIWRWLYWFIFLRHKPVIAIVIAGQSNGTNVAPGDHYTARNPNIRQMDLLGNISVAKDPLSAAEGNGATSFMLPLADNLMDRNDYGGIILIPIAVGSTTSSQWADPYDVGGRMAAARAGITKNGLNAAALLWMQGEGDSGVAAASYRANVQKARDLLALPLRFYVPQETYVNGQCSEEIRSAQRSLVDNVQFFAGPDFDQLNNTWRFDNIHFNADGMQKVAEMWAAIL